METNIERYKRKACYAELSDFDYLAKKTDFIEVSMWHNGEGYDVTINDKVVSLTDGQIHAINYLVETLNLPEKKSCNS